MPETKPELTNYTLPTAALNELIDACILNGPAGIDRLVLAIEEGRIYPYSFFRSPSAFDDHTEGCACLLGQLFPDGSSANDFAKAQLSYKYWTSPLEFELYKDNERVEAEKEMFTRSAYIGQTHLTSPFLAEVRRIALDVKSALTFIIA